VTQAGGSSINQSGSRKASSDIYTVLAFVALLCLAAGISYILMRSQVLFGSVGELFNLPKAAGWLLLSP